MRCHTHRKLEFLFLDIPKERISCFHRLFNFSESMVAVACDGSGGQPPPFFGGGGQRVLAASLN